MLVPSDNDGSNSSSDFGEGFTVEFFSYGNVHSKSPPSYGHVLERSRQAQGGGREVDTSEEETQVPEKGEDNWLSLFKNALSSK